MRRRGDGRWRRWRRRVRWGESLLFAVLLILGGVILAIHTVTWVIPHWREPTASVWGWYFLISVPLPLLVFGGVGLWWSLRRPRLSAEHAAVARTASSSVVPDVAHINDSPGTDLALRLPTASPTSVKLFGLAAFALIWNTIAWWVFVYTLLQPITSWQHIVATAGFGLLFCGSGIVLLGWIVQQLLVAFSVGPTLLEISDHPLVPNRRYRVLLTQTGTLRVRRCEVAVVCEEVTRFRQGTDTLTSRKEVYHQTLYEREDFETGGGEGMLRVAMTLKLPLGVMHSFRTEHNEVVWRLVAVVEPTQWAPIIRDSPIVVLPAILDPAEV